MQGSEIETRIFKVARQAHLQLVLTESRHSRLFRESVLKGESGKVISRYFRSSMGFSKSTLIHCTNKGWSIAGLFDEDTGEEVSKDVFD